MATEYDLVIRNAKIPKAALIPCGEQKNTSESGDSLLDVAVSANQIAAVGTQLAAGRQELDAGGDWLFPGLIDNHVHYREPGAVFKEGYVTGSAASARGGAATVGEVQNNLPLVESVEQWRAKQESVRRRSRVRVMVYGNATRNNTSKLKELAASAPGVKLFMSGSQDLEVHEEEDLRMVCAEVAEADGLLIVHAEEGPLIEQELAKFGGLPEHYSQARSPAAELLAVEKILRLARETGVRLHLFHISTAAACDAIATARTGGVDVSASTCPHYLLFSDQDVAERGAVLKCNPSIKSEPDRAGLIAAVRSGVVDILSSDHAPHPQQEKEGEFGRAPSGIPAADLFLPLLFHFVDQGILDVQQVIERAAVAPARCYRLPLVGRISAGAHADLVLVENVSRTVGDECFASKAKLSPYSGWTLNHWPSKTWVGGRLVYDRDESEDLAALEDGAPPPLPGDSDSVCC